jgi:Flp pilus assembly protein TadG
LVSERGQAGVELLLVFPIFLIFVLFAVELGLWMYQSVTVSNAVREAARYGAVNCGGNSCGTGDIEQQAVDKSSGVLAVSEVAASWVARPPADAGQKGSSIVVTATRSYTFVFFPGISVPVTSSADMRLERDADCYSSGTC